MSEAVETLGKNQLLKRSARICDLELQKVQAAVSEHFEILPKIWGVVFFHCLFGL